MDHLSHIPRPTLTSEVEAALERSPAVLLTGPRQAGKTTLARAVAKTYNADWYDLEDIRDLARLGEPVSTLENKTGLTVIDEAQNSDSLFPALRVLIDKDRTNGRFLILGSASPNLIGMSSESLAGRVSVISMDGLRFSDVASNGANEPQLLSKLWNRGGLPPSFLGNTDESSLSWRQSYIGTFLERDLSQLGYSIPATTMRRFWTMVAHYHGQIWGGSEIARSIGVSETSIRRYLDVLTDALVIFQLQPWFSNTKKRLVRSPKVFISDSGILHGLLDIANEDVLLGHPKSGASWEGFIMSQILMNKDVKNPYFWATHAGAELDLLTTIKGSPVGFEIKRTSAPKVTKSMRIALDELSLEHLFVVHSGNATFGLDDKVTAICATELLLQTEVSALCA